MKAFQKSIVISILFLNSFIGLSQSVKISGSITSQENEAIVGASIMLIGAQDSILKTYSITNKEGLFNLNYIKPDSYILKASFFGYEPYEQNITIKGTEKTLQLGTIKLVSKLLDEVVVSGQYIPIQIKGDTLEYDSRAFETKEHDVVEDLLKQLPGVEVSENGTIKVQGKEVQQVLVDGEKFFGDDATIATKNLPAKAIKKIQVFDKKSEMSDFTGVDDGSETTTINLKLKDDHKKGYFGNVLAGVGMESPKEKLDVLRYKAKGNIHYFQKKWQFSIVGMSNNINETGFSFSDYTSFVGGAQNMMRGGGFNSSGLNLSSGAGDGFLNSHASGFNFTYTPTKKTTLTSSLFLNKYDKNYDKLVERETYFSDSTVYTDEIENQLNITYNNRANIQFEQKIDSTHFIKINGSGTWNSADNKSDNYIINFDQIGKLASSFNTELVTNNLQYTGSVGANYRKKFKKPGRNTGFGLDYNISNNDNTTYLDYLNTLASNGLLTESITSQVQTMDQSTNSIGGNFTWSEPITKKQLVQLDLAHNIDQESRGKIVSDLLGGISTFNDFLSANADYQQTNSSAKLEHKYIREKFKTTVGAKVEHLTLSGQEIFTTAKEFDFILPSALIRWEPNKKSSIKLRYGSSYNAPSLNQLQPLPNNTNPSEIVNGNIDLTPEYNHNVNLRYRSYNQFNFTFFMASFTGNLVNNNITYSQKINRFYVKEITPENLGQEKSFNSYFVYGTSIHAIKTKFHISTSANISNGLVNLNRVQDEYTTYNFSPSLSLDNIGKKVIDARGGLSYNYSINQYKDNESFNNNYKNWSYYVNLTLKLKDRWIINSTTSHAFYPDFENNNQIIIANFNIGYNFLKSRQLQVTLQGKDLLNQNTGISQYYLQNIYEQQTTQSLGRYGMINIKYAFKKLGAKD